MASAISRAVGKFEAEGGRFGSSRRCSIPVVMAEFDTYAINLPFQRTIDWRRLLFFAGSLPCLKNHVNATADYLRSIAKLDVSSVRKAGSAGTQLVPVPRSRCMSRDIVTKHPGWFLWNSP